jgi:DNA-binding IclR family transcriptional regulator
MAPQSDSERLRDEFLSMPALCLTVPQVARLLNLPVVSAIRLLKDLEGEGFLVHASGGAYRLAHPLLS